MPQIEMLTRPIGVCESRRTNDKYVTHLNAFLDACIDHVPNQQTFDAPDGRFGVCTKQGARKATIKVRGARKSIALAEAAGVCAPGPLASLEEDGSNANRALAVPRFLRSSLSPVPQDGALARPSTRRMRVRLPSRWVPSSRARGCYHSSSFASRVSASKSA
jgi:hypothetical protein